MTLTNLTQANLVTIDQINSADALALIKEAQEFKAGKQVVLKRPAYAINLFFENSTRTKTSFQMAEMKLGMQVLNFDVSTSSVKKGESLYDTLKTVESIGVNIAVVRHPQTDYYQDLLDSHNLKLGLVNAGDGSGQHPSQCLLDMMTVYEQFKQFKGLKVLIVGDIRHSRVARSNAEMLWRLGAKVYFAGPKAWADSQLEKYGQTGNLEQLLPEMDVINLLRVQHERISGDANASFSAESYRQQFGLTDERAQQLKPNAIILHPGPVNRGVEIDDDLVESKHSRIFAQMENGVFARMAILSRILRYQKFL
ncbi:Aspartate carbamoyltransferase [Pediococcus damnosus]|uniref:Aspartate carbamoyltransferase n=1 Tax=Pediococcus damnosus TaxID=51663 RepID=A0AAC9B0C7_9LACO|nr:Aspartate carbamoyltransferase [Pediococcus damnosus]KJU74332.1 aspartate carbamoyltransferase catalytic subunit [Pediococcus damnosus LMG 28219]AMV66169.1 Aspartate carbamoyltransferase [Pediococcus damnosus]AMV68454.1 Aspartate carbamoyltransferase [Pediococcus damnosus]PIO80238.1 aspartate carbamoyltransferase [Pediococcus damnosus]